MSVSSLSPTAILRYPCLRPRTFFFFLLYIPVHVWPDFSVYTWSSDPHQCISCPFRRHRSRFECCTTVTSKQTLPQWNVWRDAGDRRIVYFMQTSCCDISASWRGTWQPYSHLASACTALCFSRLVTSLTGTAQTKASDICISSSHHGLCSALTELTNGVWSWRLWTNQTVGGDGEADERRRYRCSNLAEALETACLLNPTPPKKSAARACPARLQLIQEVIPLWAADRDRLLWLFYFLMSAINFNGQASALCSWRFFTRLRQHDCVILLLVMNWQELCVFYCNCLAL